MLPTSGARIDCAQRVQGHSWTFPPHMQQRLLLKNLGFGHVVELVLRAFVTSRSCLRLSARFTSSPLN